MTELDFRTEMEEDLKWRKEEYYFFKNLSANLSNMEDRVKYNKSLILILYSHFEGFTKDCFLTYVKYLNYLKLKNNDLNYALISSNADDCFSEIEKHGKKNKNFKKCDTYDDERLHILYRRIELIENLQNKKEDTLHLSDKIINTESNLWYIVLQKNLYKIGLPIDLFQQYEKDINKLVNLRNIIAHGTVTSGVNLNELNTLEENSLKMEEEMIKVLYSYALNKKYLRK